MLVTAAFGGKRAHAIHRQPARHEGVSRTDLSPQLREGDGHEEATPDHWSCSSSLGPSALRRALRDEGRLMFPVAVALPLALLPIVSLLATFRWMALSSG